MGDAIEALLKFFTEFSLRRFLAALAVLFLVILVLLGYDRYTSSFTLTRLRQSADLVAQLQTIESASVQRSPELEQAYASLRRQVASAIAAPPTSASSTLWMPAHPVTKFFGGAWPSLLLSLVMLPALRKGEPNALSGLIAILVMATIFGIVGLVIPTFWWPWGNCVLYPFGALGFLITLAGYITVRTRRKQAKQQYSTQTV